MQRIIRKYYKQIYANITDKVEEIDKYFEKYNLSRMNQPGRNGKCE